MKVHHPIACEEIERGVGGVDQDWLPGLARWEDLALWGRSSDPSQVPEELRRGRPGPLQSPPKVQQQNEKYLYILLCHHDVMIWCEGVCYAVIL